MNTVTWRALGALLTYPDPTLINAIGEIRLALESEPSIPDVLRPRLRSLLDYLQSTDPWTLEESYVEQFDTGRSTSLHLFEHVHGESRDRGQAMVDLKTQYEMVGLTLHNTELPDYLPAFLEFCSVASPETALEFLGECTPILEAIGQRLEERRSPYSAVFPVLTALAGTHSGRSLPEVKPEKNLDEEWEEEPAFTHPQGAC